MKKITVLVLALSLSMLFVAGCGPRRAKRLAAPDYNASAISAEAIKQYDTNGDGQLSGEELDAAKSIKSSFPGMTAVTATDIANRVRMWKESRLGLLAASVVVVKNGKPVPNASVAVSSEDFMGGNKIQFSVQTSEDGRTGLSMENEDGLPGIQCGYYKIDVTVDGKTYPFGVEIAKDSRALNDSVARLEIK